MNLFFLLLLQLGFGFSSNSQLQPQSCLDYQSTNVALTGKISRKTFAGPPNFENIKNGDKPETYWILHLTKPICVDAGKDTPDIDRAEKNISDIQLVLNKDQYGEYKTLLGKQVNVSGKLFHAISGHHHTNILLEKAEIKAR